ncbi:putative membrane protein [Luteibacter sp. HA06]|jgi:putative membrane protein
MNTPPSDYHYAPAAADGVIKNDPAVELSARRTGMSFQRTRMSTDRTLMSVMRTSVSLISFGFTIAQFFQHLRAAKLLPQESAAPRNFGIALVGLGIAMLVLGIIYHLHYMRALRAERHAMAQEGLIHGETPYPVSLTLLIAMVMLMFGIVAIISMTAHVGPFD